MILNFDPQFINASKILNNVIDVNSKSSLTSKYYGCVIGIVVRLGITLDKKILSKFYNLQFIATITTGMDHVDLEYCKIRKIKVISLKGETRFLNQIHATPELTWGLILSLVRNIPGAFESIKQGKWERIPFFGNELFNKTIGIIGFGRVGKILGRYANAFGMQVLAFDKLRQNKLDYVFKQASLREVLCKSDIVTLCLPLDESTQYLFNQDCFKLMKKTAIFINTSRGVIVDERALLMALKNKKICGAAIDVVENEHIRGCIKKSHPLIEYARKNQNLIITPHIAGMTYESMEKTAGFIAEKIRIFLISRGY